MKKIICLIFAIVFYILGIIGLIILIIPQIPFFIIGTIFIIIGFESIKEKILENNFYKQHLKNFVDKNKTLKNYHRFFSRCNSSDSRNLNL